LWGAKDDRAAPKGGLPGSKPGGMRRSGGERYPEGEQKPEARPEARELERESGFIAVIPTEAGANRRGRRSGRPNGFREGFRVARKRQARSFDLVTVARRRAVIASE
jgi:hypothetical protein